MANKILFWKLNLIKFNDKILNTGKNPMLRQARNQKGEEEDLPCPFSKIQNKVP